MLISTSHRFIFVHVPKTGGTSIRRTLEPHCLPVRANAKYARLMRAVGLPLDYRRYPFSVHDSLKAVERRMPRDLFASMFKFGFVRNPWSRLVSHYLFLRAQPGHPQHHELMNLDFAAFVEREIRRGSRTQMRRLVGKDGALAVDFVGRFESLGEDFARIGERIGIEPRLGHRFKGPSTDYRDHYDDATRERVARYWREDVEAFEYRF